MSWYIEPYKGSSTPSSDRDTGDAAAAFFGAATGLATSKAAFVAGFAVAGPVGATVAGIGWIGISVAKSVWIRNALCGKGAS